VGILPSSLQTLREILGFQVALTPLNGRWRGRSQLDLIFLAFLSFWG
jgi:hypothetical protein